MRFVCDVWIELCVYVDDAKKIDIISIQFVAVARNMCLMTFYHFLPLVFWWMFIFVVVAFYVVIHCGWMREIILLYGHLERIWYTFFFLSVSYAEATMAFFLFWHCASQKKRPTECKSSLFMPFSSLTFCVCVYVWHGIISELSHAICNCIYLYSISVFSFVSVRFYHRNP